MIVAVALAVDQSQLTARREALEIKPGVQADVERETGGKTILTHLTKPLYKSNEVLRERSFSWRFGGFTPPNPRGIFEQRG